MDIFSILQWSHVVVALLIILVPGYRATGTWLLLSAVGYLYTIEPDIAAVFANGPEDKQQYTYVTYLITDLIFAFCHYFFGGKGSVYQSKLLFIFGIMHGYAYLEFMHYVPMMGFMKLVYTPAIIAVNILQIAFLTRGVVDAIRTFRQSLRSGTLDGALRGWGRKMLAENPS